MARRGTKPIDRFLAASRERSEDQTFMERVVRPLMLRVTGFGGRFLSQSAQNSMRERLMRAGYPGGLRAQQWMSFKIIGAFLFPLVFEGIAGIFKWRFKFDFGFLHFSLVAVAGALLGYMTPDLILRRFIGKRKKMIQKTLPDLIDLMAVSVEAGLGFDAALQRVSSRFKGPLGEEVQRVMQEISLGRPRIEALREMARRVDVADVHSFITALVQADQLGVSIGNVLRVQSDQMRERRSQRAREAAQKTPVKMMIPLVLFVFPALFVVIMGPACIKGYQTLQGTGLF